MNNINGLKLFFLLIEHKPSLSNVSCGLAQVRWPLYISLCMGNTDKNKKEHNHQ